VPDDHDQGDDHDTATTDYDRAPDDDERVRVATTPHWSRQAGNDISAAGNDISTDGDHYAAADDACAGDHGPAPGHDGAGHNPATRHYGRAGDGNSDRASP
jgi:hypothetical protein